MQELLGFVAFIGIIVVAFVVSKRGDAKHTPTSRRHRGNASPTHESASGRGLSGQSGGRAPSDYAAGGSADDGVGGHGLGGGSNQ